MSHDDAAAPVPRAPSNPYIGLRPYQESESQWFFGRDADRKIFVDMLLANRLTLLFAASGVGKSSLLQASVLPYLKDPAHENLDAVYCNNWAGNPMVSIRQATLAALAARDRIPTEALSNELSTLPLPRFFSLCSHFTRPPLILVLDQFEEFFHYHRGTPGFSDYKDQIVQLISDESIAVSIIISMREDFALALNAFKPDLPTILFNKFYRLEKLTRADAEAAIVRPAERVGFQYEPELLEALLTDLAARERSSRAGTPIAETTLHVEPPYLQIVCSQLFELDKHNRDHTLKLSTYKAQGRALGLLASHIDRVTSALSGPERKLASQCFSHLITRRGTKVAHTADSLARELRVDKDRLERVLRALEEARLLRSQSQDQQTWFELYHDLFSESVDQWNERFKARERRRRTLLTVGAIVATGTLTCAALIGAVNATNHHLRLSSKGGPNTQVELYHGRADTPDPFGQQNYVGETGIVRQKIDADLRFNTRPVKAVRQLYTEWAVGTPIATRLQLYRSDGDINNALDVAQGALTSEDQSRASDMIYQLARIGSKRSFGDKLAFALSGNKNLLAVRALSSVLDNEREEIELVRDRLIINYRFSPSRTAVDFLIQIINSPTSALRPEAAGRLGAWKEPRAAKPLAALLCKGSVAEREAAAAALIKIGVVSAVWPLGCKLSEQSEDAQLEIVQLLETLKVRAAVAEVEQLITPAHNHPTALRARSLLALGTLGAAPEQLDRYLSDPVEEVAVAAATALEQSKPKGLVPTITKLLGSAKEVANQVKLATTLAQLGDPGPLTKKLADPNARQSIFKYVESEERYRYDFERNCATNGNLMQLFVSNAQTLEGVMSGAEVKFLKRLVRCMGSLFPAGSERLLSQLAFVPDFELNLLAVRRLIDSKDDSKSDLALTTLQRMLGDKVYERRMLAARSLGDLDGPAATKSLSDVAGNLAEPVLLRGAALRALAAQARRLNAPNQKLVQQMRQVMRDPAHPPELRAAAAVVLANSLHVAAIEDLTSLLNDAEESVRKEALAEIFELRDPQAVKKLDEFLSTPKAKWRDEISLLMGEMLGREAALTQHTTRLATLIPEDGGVPPSSSRPEIKKIIDKLSLMGRPISPKPLALALDSKTQEVRNEALDAVVVLGEAVWRENLGGVVFDSEKWTLRRALSAYVKLVRPIDIPKFAEQIESSSMDVQFWDISKFLCKLESPIIYDKYGERIFQQLVRYSSIDEEDYALSTKAFMRISGEKRRYWQRLGFSEIDSRKIETREVELTPVGMEVVARELTTYDWDDTRRAVVKLRKMPVARSSILLLDLLRHRNGEVVSVAGELLVEHNEKRALKPLLNALAETDDESIDNRWRASVKKLTATLGQQGLESQVGRDRRFAPMLAAACLEPARTDLSAPNYLTIRQRVAAARMVSGSSGDCSAEVLAPLARDPSIQVRVAAATALSGLKTPRALTELHRLIVDPNPRVQLAAAKSLVESADQTSVEPIRAALFKNDQTPAIVMQQLLRALGKIKNQEATSLLIEAVKQGELTVGLRGYRILGDLQMPFVQSQLQAELKKQLKKHVDTAERFRQHRDEPTPEAAPADAAVAKVVSAQQTPNSFLLFELAVAMARLSEEDEIIDLLHHDLADVREGAALGAALRGSPKLVARLDELRENSAKPLFRHAAYQTIDTTLEIIEALGTEDDLKALRDMQNQIHDQNGVKARVDWTLYELEGRLHEQKGSAGAANQGH